MTVQSNLTKYTVLYFWRCAKKYPSLLVGLGFSLPFTVLLNQTIPPIILASVLNRLSQHDFTGHNVWHSFGAQLLMYGFVTLIGSSVMWRITDFIVWRLEGYVSKAIAQHVFRHLISQSATFHANNFGGSLVSQTNKLMSGYVRVQDTTVFSVIPLLLSILFSVIVLAHVAPLYALVLFLFSVIYTAVAMIITRKVRRLGSLHSALESKQTGFLADAITNAMAIKSFSGGSYERSRFTNSTNQTHRSLKKFSLAHQKQQIYFGALLGGIEALALVAAVVSVMIFNANIAAVFLIFSYTSNIAQQLFQFGNSSLRQYNRAIGDAADMIRILRTEPEVVDPLRPEKAQISHGAIIFKDVEFQHDGSDDAIFEHLNLHIKPGEKVGLVGHSGSGKTTFTRVLQRFSDIQSGQILIDGQDISKITQDDLHQHIAYVPQEPLLFHRSIADNIRYGDPSASFKEIEAAAKMASADGFISGLSDGYDTLVGERGVKLSGGQRQRIAIARAMLKNAPVLVLDEATSALDSESEAAIQAALWKLMEGRTAIAIAHRLSTIQRMDRIIVLQDGKITEQGSHQELVAHNGTYAQLWARQSGGFIDD